MDCFGEDNSKFASLGMLASEIRERDNKRQEAIESTGLQIGRAQIHEIEMQAYESREYASAK